MKRFSAFYITVGLLLMAGCGGGSGGGTSTGGGSVVTTAQVTLSTTGNPGVNKIGGIDITLNLPVGVTVKASPSPVNSAVLVPDSGVVVLQGEAATATSQMVLTTYVKETGTSPARISFRLVNADGIGTGTFAVVNCDVAAGSSPVPADFSVTPNIAPTGIFNVATAALAAVTTEFSVLIK